MGIATDLRRTDKEKFCLFMAAQGYSEQKENAPYSHSFYKIANKEIYVCSIQWDKYGKARFVLSFGRCALTQDLSHSLQLINFK